MRYYGVKSVRIAGYWRQWMYFFLRVSEQGWRSMKGGSEREGSKTMANSI